MNRRILFSLAGLLLAVVVGGTSFGQTTIVSDNYQTTNNGSGFALNEGVNTSINPPATTRLTGTAASSLRYIQTATAKPASQYDIGNNRLRVVKDTDSGKIGRFTLSANGVTPFNFASALGTAGATPSNPALYDIKISMRNDATGTARFSFGIGTAEGDVTTWDFGVQIYRPSGADYYAIQKRIDDGSSGAGDINAVILNTAAGTWQTMLDFLIRVTDAGAESDANYHSRVQVSMDNGSTWIYDSSTDSALPNGWRFDGPGRVIIWDQAGNTGGNVFYDDFSVVSTYAPPPPPERVWTGAGASDNWSDGANWGGTAPVSGEPLLFGLAARQANNNDLVITTPTLTFSNGGFALSGSQLAIESAVNNLVGNNTINLPLDWPNTGPKNWQMAAGTTLNLSGSSALATVGDHVVFGGGTLRLTGSLDINQNPAFIISEGKFVLDGGVFNSIGGFRIGSLVSASAPVEVVVSNSASLTLKAAGANLRVGDGAADVINRLIVNNGTVTMLGGSLGIPYAAGCTGEVSQVGGLVKDCYVAFSDSGAGVGTYAVDGGILEPFQIRKDTAGGMATMRFNNAFLRPAAGANTDFMRGLDVAEIQAGGLTIDAQYDVVIAQNLIGAGGLTKSGPATVTLAGANSYAGSTLVQAGKLVLSTGSTYAGAIQVADSTELGVLVQTPGTTLTNSSLSLGASTLSFDLGNFTTPTAPLLKVSTLSANGAVTINVANGLALAKGQIVLVDYDGAIGGGGFGAFSLVGLPPSVSATLVNNTVNSSIDLKITAVPGFLWTGAVNGDWDTTTQNWLDQLTGSPSAYMDSLPTEFRDGAATGVVNLVTYPAPSVIIVSNDTLPYLWSGNPINTPILIKNGPGSLTRAGGEADFITTIELNAGSYVVSNLYDATLASVLTDTSAGTGTFGKRGASTLTVTSTNTTFEGTTVIQDGVLKLGNTRALGATNATILITNGGTLDMVDHQPAQPVIVSGAGVDGQGAIIDSTASGGVEANLQDVIMTGDTTLGCPQASARWDLRVRASTGPGPGLRGNGHKLTKVGSGMVSFACERDFGAATPYWTMDLGDILISEGNLAFAGSLDLGNPSASLTVSSGAILQLYDLGFTNPVRRIITMTDARLNSSATAAHTNVVNGGFHLTGLNTFWCNESHLIINGPVSGSGSVALFANNPGTLLLNATNTYTGDTTVTNGTISGMGVLAGNLVMLGGTNSPGMGIGTLTVHGAATLAGTTLMELNRSLSPNSDRLVVGGTLTFGGVLQVVLGAGAPAPQAGDVYQLFNKGSGSTFAAINLPNLSGLPGGLTWDTSNLMVNGTIAVQGAVAPPTIGAVSLSGGDFLFSGTGGVEGSSYYVVTSPNVEAPLAGWSVAASNVFGPGGSFSYTTNITGGAPKAFFRLLVP